MSRRKLILIAVVVLAIAAEVGFNQLKEPEACVQIVNQCDEPMERLEVASGRSKVTIDRVAVGDSVRVMLSGRGPRPLKLSYRQGGNSLAGFELPMFDAEELERDGYRLVLNVKGNQFERYQEKLEPKTLWGRLVHEFEDWLMWVR